MHDITIVIPHYVIYTGYWIIALSIATFISYHIAKYLTAYENQTKQKHKNRYTN